MAIGIRMLFAKPTSTPIGLLLSIIPLIPVMPRLFSPAAALGASGLSMSIPRLLTAEMVFERYF
jgi:hypothetical protein